MPRVQNGYGSHEETGDLVSNRKRWYCVDATFWLSKDTNASRGPWITTSTIPPRDIGRQNRLDGLRAELLEFFAAHRTRRRSDDSVQHDNNADLDDNDLSHVLARMSNGMHCR